MLSYFGYARQDRKPGPRTPISAKLVANLVTTAGADRVLPVDLHAGQIQGFFDIPTDNLFAAPVTSADIHSRFPGKQWMVVSPDVGGVVRARALCPSGSTTPRSPSSTSAASAPGRSEVMNIIGNVEGRFCILIDDIVDSAGTLCNAAAALKASGAEDVVAYCTHGVLSGGAVARVDGSASGRARDHRLDRQSRCDRRKQQDPSPDDRAPARRGDQADRRRELGLLAVRLIPNPAK